MSFMNAAPSAQATESKMTRSRVTARAGLRVPYALTMIGLTAAGCGPASGVTLERSGPPLIVRSPALYPEAIEYNPTSDRFLVSSFRNGAVYEVDGAGEVSLLVDDERLCAVLGLAVDSERGRLWAVNSDLGVSIKSSAEGARALAAVGVYDLATGAALSYVDLAPLAPGDHLANGIALDSAGNAYVTDSFSPTIYKIDPEGQASVFLQDEQFAGEGVNLNGVVVHPDGYLLVVKKSDGSLFKVPLANPSQFSRIDIAETFEGGDGLILVGKQDLVLIANQVPGTASNSAFLLSSADGWASAEPGEVLQLGDVYPTTGTLRDGRLYVIHSKLNELLQSTTPEQRERLQMEATIQQIGTVAD
jgi:DNA-binding beta-propeller fold protein YncE